LKLAFFVFAAALGNCISLVCAPDSLLLQGQYQRWLRRAWLTLKPLQDIGTAKMEPISAVPQGARESVKTP
jgi:hypothetical protein